MNYVSGVLGSVHQDYKLLFNKSRLNISLEPPLVGCVVNRESEHEERFYLRSHPKKPNAVFVFREAGEPEENGVMVSLVVDDINFECKYGTYFI